MSRQAAEPASVRKHRDVEQWFVGRHALDSQVLSERDEQGIIHGAAIFDGDLECLIEERCRGLHVDWDALQNSKGFAGLRERDQFLALVLPDCVADFRKDQIKNEQTPACRWHVRREAQGMGRVRLGQNPLRDDAAVESQAGRSEIGTLCNRLSPFYRPSHHPASPCRTISPTSFHEFLHLLATRANNGPQTLPDLPGLPEKAVENLDFRLFSNFPWGPLYACPMLA